MESKDFRKAEVVAKTQFLSNIMNKTKSLTKGKVFEIVGCSIYFSIPSFRKNIFSQNHDFMNLDLVFYQLCPNCLKKTKMLVVDSNIETFNICFILKWYLENINFGTNFQP